VGAVFLIYNNLVFFRWRRRLSDEQYCTTRARVKISGTHWKQPCNAFQCVPGML